jgi:hypothetical protein
MIISLECSRALIGLAAECLIMGASTLLDPLYIENSAYLYLNTVLDERRIVLSSMCLLYCTVYTDKKENLIFLIYRETQSGAFAKTYVTNGLLIYGEIFAHFLIY